MLQIKYRNTFAKDLKLAKKRGKDLSKLQHVIRSLVEQRPLDQKYRDHVLLGNYKGRRECHVEPDWLLIYKQASDLLILERMGSHSDLFN